MAIHPRSTGRFQAILASCCVAVVVLAGCAGTTPGPAPERMYPAGIHPYPDPDNPPWPLGPDGPMQGPFDLGVVESVRVTSFDGIPLDGWIVRPDLPAGVKAPVVLWSAPYFGQCSYLPNTADPASYPVCSYALGDDPSLWDADSVSEAVPVNVLRQAGYAVAMFNVRGTGNSGGCFEWFGPKEQRDQAVLVEWLGTQDWSNGHVAMMGLSYHGTTPWEAAIQNPPHLKTIIVGGMVSDAYTFSATPQGAMFAIAGVFADQFALRVSLSPPINGPLEHATLEHIPVTADRVCEEVLMHMGGAWSESYTDIRDVVFWSERRLIDHFPDVEAAVFLTHGFLDLFGSGHQQQENAVWDLLPGPKRMLEGQWGHQMPKPGAGSIEADAWHAMLLEWLDFWLKGIGDGPPREGWVDYEDGTGTWHASRGWPPLEARSEVLYLTASGLSAAPGQGAGAFRSAPGTGDSSVLMCGGLAPAGAPLLGAEGIIYVSDPAPTDLLIAGNPFAYLQVEADQPGGLVSLHLYAFDGDPCQADHWASGTADLRFHAGNFAGRDFPMGVPTPVRIDITNLAEVLPAGHRLAVTASYGDLVDRTNQPWRPLVRLHGGDGPQASHIVLPLVEGTMGGAAPAVDYPARPFVPPA